MNDLEKYIKKPETKDIEDALVEGETSGEPRQFDAKENKARIKSPENRSLSDVPSKFAAFSQDFMVDGRGDQDGLSGLVKEPVSVEQRTQRTRPSPPADMDLSVQSQRAKQTIVIRKDLNIQKGKMVAQGAHASLLAIMGDPKKVSGDFHLLSLDDAMRDWFSSDYRTICLGAESEAALMRIYEQATSAGLRCTLVQDLGHTESGGQPTYTAVAIGPEGAAAIDAITHGLKPL